MHLALRHALLEGVGGWRDVYALADLDYLNGRFWFNGAFYADEASVNVAMGATKSGIERTVGPLVVGTEILADGGFASGQDSWDEAPTYAANGSLAVVSQQLNAVQSASNYRIRRPTTVEAGQGYLLQGTAITMLANSGSLSIASSTDLNNASSASFGFGASNVTKSVAFGASGTTCYPGIMLGTVTSPPKTSIFDAFSLVKADPYPGFVKGAVASRITGTTPGAASGNKVLQQWGDDSEVRRVRLVWGADKHFHLIVTNDNVAQADIDIGVVEVSTAYDIELTAAANRFAARVNGGATLTDTAGTIPGIAKMWLGRSFTGESWDGTIDRLRAYASERAPADLFYTEGDSYVAGSGGVGLAAALATASSRGLFSTASGGSDLSGVQSRIQAGLTSGVFVIWDGDANTNTDPVDYLARLASIVAGLRTSRYIVLPPLKRANKSSQDNAATDTIRAAMATTYAGHYFDPMSTLNALAVSPGDDATLAAGQVPASLLQGDLTHLTTTPMNAVAAALWSLISSNGW